jgi:hypothetical protein
MHVMALHGVITKTLLLALNKLRKTHVVDWEQMRVYISSWFYQQIVRGGQNPCKVLKAKRVESEKKTGVLKCQAREWLALLPVVACFVFTAIIPGAQGELLSVGVHDCHRAGKCARPPGSITP